MFIQDNTFQVNLQGDSNTSDTNEEVASENDNNNQNDM